MQVFVDTLIPRKSLLYPSEWIWRSIDRAIWNLNCVFWYFYHQPTDLVGSGWFPRGTTPSQWIDGTLGKS